MGADVQQFVQSVVASGLLDAGALTAVERELRTRQVDMGAGDDIDPGMLAEELTSRGLLTPYQQSKLLDGRRFRFLYDDYVILDEIGSGGMATVYKARNKTTGEIVALKVLSEEAAMSVETNYRFDRELQAASKVSHPNIVVALDGRVSPEYSYMALEYVDGPSLDAYVSIRGPLPPLDAAEIVLQIARGMDHAHDKRIIHRDLKPENVLRASDGTVKILDLGLARFDNMPRFGDKSDSMYRLTQLGVVLGTADYMAPEQSMDARRADFRADIYSLGCTLWFLLTGEGPYSRRTAMATMMAHQTEPLPKITDKRKDLPKPLLELLEQMLSKDPAARPSSMQAIVERLELLLGKRAPPPPPPRPGRVTRRKVKDVIPMPLGQAPPRQRMWVVWGMLVGATLGMLGWYLDLATAREVVIMVRGFIGGGPAWGVVVTTVVGGAVGAAAGFLLNEIA